MRKEHAMNTAHKATTLAVKVRVDFLLKGGFVEVAGADGDTESDGFFLGLAGYVLVDGDGGVDATAFAEEGAYGAAGTLGGNEDDVDVGGHVDFGEVLEDGGETVGEVEGLSKAGCVSCCSDRNICVPKAREKSFSSNCIPFPWSIEA